MTSPMSDGGGLPAAPNTTKALRASRSEGFCHLMLYRAAEKALASSAWARFTEFDGIRGRWMRGGDVDNRRYRKRKPAYNSLSSLPSLVSIRCHNDGKVAILSLRYRHASAPPPSEAPRVPYPLDRPAAPGGLLLTECAQKPKVLRPCWDARAGCGRRSGAAEAYRTRVRQL